VFRLRPDERKHKWRANLDKATRNRVMWCADHRDDIERSREALAQTVRASLPSMKATKLLASRALSTTRFIIFLRAPLSPEGGKRSPPRLRRALDQSVDADPDRSPRLPYAIFT
jgi:hypothetical protein